MDQEARISRMTVSTQRSGQRVIVELDDGQTFELDPEIIVQRRLKAGAALDPETIEQLKLEDETLQARRKLVSYLSLRVKSVADARLYLEKAKFREPAIDAAIADSTARGLLDDRRFAESFVRTQLKISNHGPLRLLADLIGHGIDSSLAEDVLRPRFDSEWQRESAEALARKQFAKRSVAEVGEEEGAERAVKKIYDYLQRQGYSGEIARDVAEKVVRGRKGS